MFENLFDVKRRCDSCGFFFSRESGFFLGSAYIGYAATVGVAILVWTLSRAAGLGWDLRVLGILLLVVAVFPVWFFRYARMLWLALDLYLNPPVREDFQTRGR